MYAQDWVNMGSLQLLAPSTTFPAPGFTSCLFNLAGLAWPVGGGQVFWLILVGSIPVSSFDSPASPPGPPQAQHC